MEQVLHPLTPQEQRELSEKNQEVIELLLLIGRLHDVVPPFGVNNDGSALVRQIPDAPGPAPDISRVNGAVKPEATQ